MALRSVDAGPRVPAQNPLEILTGAASVGAKLAVAIAVLALFAYGYTELRG